jgi:hypothetical protein
MLSQRGETPLKRSFQQKLSIDLPPTLRISRFRLSSGRQGGETTPVRMHPSPGVWKQSGNRCNRGDRRFRVLDFPVDDSQKSIALACPLIRFFKANRHDFTTGTDFALRQYPRYNNYFSVFNLLSMGANLDRHTQRGGAEILKMK